MRSWLTNLLLHERSSCACGCSRVLHEGARLGAPCAVCGDHCNGYVQSRSTGIPTSTPAREREAVSTSRSSHDAGNTTDSLSMVS